MRERVFSLVFRLSVLGLLFTGFAQMPIFVRYYLADVPGFAWTADYYLNHVLHYGLAVVLLVVLGRKAVLVARRKWTAGGTLLALCWLGVVATGLVRVMKNQPETSFSPLFVLIVDWGHLGFVLLVGMVGLALAVGFGRRSLCREARAARQ